MSAKKNRKYGRNVNRGQAVLYKSQGREERNRKRRMRRHLASNPFDKKGRERYSEEWGGVQHIELNSKGRKLVERADFIARAVERASEG